MNKKRNILVLVVFIVIIVAVITVGCKKHNDSIKSETNSNNITKKELTEEELIDTYKAQISKATNKDIKKVIVEDFDKNGKKEAFVLVKVKAGEYELWYASDKESIKVETAINTYEKPEVELIKTEKYIHLLLNAKQPRQTYDYYTVIYGIKNDKPAKLFAQNYLNLSITDNEIFGAYYTYTVFDPYLKGWLCGDDQWYHFYWNEDTQTYEEYVADTISETEFLKITGAEKLKEKINNKVNKKYTNKVTKKVTNIEYTYLARNDNSIDINMIVSTKNGEKYKLYATVSYKNNSVGMEFELADGNKEKSLLKILNQWKTAYVKCLKEHNSSAKGSVEFVLKDIGGYGYYIPSLIVKEEQKLTIYTSEFNGRLKKLKSKDFMTGTTRFLYSDNAKYPGIFYFYESGGLNHYGYIDSRDGKIKISELWNEDYSGISKELGEERDVIEELSSNKKLIKESERVYNENLDLPFTVVNSELLTDLENKISDYEIK